MKWDKWQLDFLQTPGHKCLRSGRQSGKSTVVGKYGADFALKYSNKTVLIIAAVERQAYLLFDKVMQNLPKSKILGRPTKTKVSLSNGSVIYCLPTGLSGNNIRGYTVDLLIADEAAFIPDAVWVAVTPMLATTKGDIVLLSTPYGKQGYFYERFEDDTFTKFHISSEDCPRIPKSFLEQEKKRLTKLAYAQEYLGEFLDDLKQYFPTELIESCMEDIPKDLHVEKNYLGIDVAGMGEDETVFFSLGIRKGKLYETDLKVTTKTRLTDTLEEIKYLDQQKKYKYIGIDDGGIGIGLFDMALEDKQIKRRVVALNNSHKSADAEDGKKKLLKEDMYGNLKAQMEQGRLRLRKDPDTMLSLKSIQADIHEGKIKIYGADKGKHTHITEALIRAAWVAKNKNLNMWIAY